MKAIIFLLKLPVDLLDRCQSDKPGLMEVEAYKLELEEHFSDAKLDADKNPILAVLKLTPQDKTQLQEALDNRLKMMDHPVYLLADILDPRSKGERCVDAFKWEASTLLLDKFCNGDARKREAVFRALGHYRTKNGAFASNSVWKALEIRRT